MSARRVVRVAVVVGFVAFTVGLLVGHEVGRTNQTYEDAAEFRRLVHHANYVARVTGVPIYQVLTGKEATR